MSTLAADTTPQVERLLVERLRQMPPWRKMALMAETIRTLALAGLCLRHPDDTPALRRRRLADPLIGPELASRARGPWPEVYE